MRKGGRLLRFNAEEDAYIIAHASHDSAVVIASALGRHKDAVYKRMRILEDQGRLTDRRRFNRPWTAEEIARARALLAVYSLEVTCQELGRTKEGTIRILEQHVTASRYAMRSIDPRWMDTQTVCRLLAVTDAHLRRWIVDGHIQTMQPLGRKARHFVTPGELFRFVRDHTDALIPEAMPASPYRKELEAAIRREMGQWLTTKEVATLKGLPVKSVQHAIRQGGLPADRSPAYRHQWRIRRADALAWIPRKPNGYEKKRKAA